MKRVSAAEAKARFSELLSQVAYGGEQVVIERHGKPVAALVPADRVENKEKGTAAALLSLAGAFDGILTDDEVDAFIKDVYESRERDLGRPPIDLDEP